MTAENTTPNKPVIKAPATPVTAAAPKAAAKPAAKPVAKPATKPKAVVAPKAKPVAKPAVKTAVVKAVKAKKTKMVRDSFTFPKDEYTVMDTLKLRAAKLGHPIKKTELLRAGVKAITAMTDTALLSAMKAVPSLKTGRPAKS